MQVGTRTRVGAAARTEQSPEPQSWNANKPASIEAEAGHRT
jgi:hypothetical protein